MQNHVLLLNRRAVWIRNKVSMTAVAMAPATILGVYGQRMYFGTAVEASSARAVGDMLGWAEI